MKTVSVLAVSALFSIVAASAQAAPVVDSVYQNILTDDPSTPQKEGSCKVVEEGGELGDYARIDCGNTVGYHLFVIYGDAREWLSISNGAREWDFFGFNDGAFNTLPSKVVEWRGMRKGDSFEPYALIVRSHNISLEFPGAENDPRRDELHVIKVSKGEMCRIGKVSGAVTNANAAARQLADKKALTTKCTEE